MPNIGEYAAPQSLNKYLFVNSDSIQGIEEFFQIILIGPAWQALRVSIEEHCKFEPAALMVLHTWNQELDHHPHLHAIVPGGGPALDGSGSLSSKHPTEKRDKPYLLCNIQLGKKFRERFISGFKKLVQQDKLRLE